MLSIKDIQNITHQKNERKKELYKKILESFSKKIKSQVDIGQTQVFLCVPPYVFGYPVYDRGVARTYLARQLENLGYTVAPYQDFELYVTWNAEKKKKTYEPEIGLPAFVNLHKIADDYRNKKR